MHGHMNIKNAMNIRPQGLMGTGASVIAGENEILSWNLGHNHPVVQPVVLSLYCLSYVILKYVSQ